jgi:hypothetical protein
MESPATKLMLRKSKEDLILLAKRYDLLYEGKSKVELARILGVAEDRRFIQQYESIMRG